MIVLLTRGAVHCTENEILESAQKRASQLIPTLDGLKCDSLFGTDVDDRQIFLCDMCNTLLWVKPRSFCAHKYFLHYYTNRLQHNTQVEWLLVPWFPDSGDIHFIELLVRQQAVENL